MQGHSHSLTGAAGWLALTGAAAIPASVIARVVPGAEVSVPLGVNPLGVSPEVAVAGAVACAGAALMPDMDHPQGMIAHSLPPVTNVACAGVETVSGGHRHGTHSIIGVAAFTGLAWMASFITASVGGRTVAAGAGVFAVFLVAFALKALHVRLGSRKSVLGTFLGPWLVSVGSAGAATYLLDYQWTWLPAAVGLGALIHLAGDALTTQGVPLLWPWNPAPPRALLNSPGGRLMRVIWQDNGYLRVPLLADTGSIRETLFAVVVALYVIVVLVCTIPRLT